MAGSLRVRRLGSGEAHRRWFLVFEFRAGGDSNIEGRCRPSRRREGNVEKAIVVVASFVS